MQNKDAQIIIGGNQVYHYRDYRVRLWLWVAVRLVIAAAIIASAMLSGCGTETAVFPSLQPQYISGKYFVIVDQNRDGWVSYSDPNGGEDDIFASVYPDTIPDGEHVWGKLPDCGKIEIVWTCGGICQVWDGRDMLFSDPDGKISWLVPEVESQLPTAKASGLAVPGT